MLVTVRMTRVHDGGRSKRLQDGTRHAFIHLRSSTATIHVAAPLSGLRPWHAKLVSGVARCNHFVTPTLPQAFTVRWTRRMRPPLTVNFGNCSLGEWFIIDLLASVSGSRTMCWAGSD